MANATIQSYNRLAVVFDFDETLAPDSLDSLLESGGSTLPPSSGSRFSRWSRTAGTRFSRGHLD